MYNQAPVIIPKVQFSHSNGAHVIDDMNVPVKRWAKGRANALFKSFKLLPLEDKFPEKFARIGILRFQYNEKIDNDNEAIKRACEPAGGLRSKIAFPPRRDVASRIFEGECLPRGSALVFDEKEMAREMLAGAVENGRVYSVKAVALVRGVPLAVHKSLLFGLSGFWMKSREFADAYRHLDTVLVMRPSAEKFNTTGNYELLVRGTIKHKEDDFEFSICVQNPRMQGNVKVCDFAFIVTNNRSLTAGRLGRILEGGKSLDEWLGKHFSNAEVSLLRLLPPHMKKDATVEWVLFRER